MLNPPPSEPGQDNPVHDNPIRWSDDGASFYGECACTDRPIKCVPTIRVMLESHWDIPKIHFLRCFGSLQCFSQ